MSKKLKIIYMGGGPSYTIEPLKRLIESRHEVICIYAKKPKPSGRGRKIKNSPLIDFAKKSNLKYRVPENLKDKKEIDFLKRFKADLFLVFSYGIILPEKVLDIPKYGCINIHASILPKWRGPSPVQYALLNNEKKTGFTFMKMNMGIDTGDILYSKEIQIAKEDNTVSLLNKISLLSGEFLIEILDLYINKKIFPVAQDESEATYSYKIKKEDAFLNFAEPALSVFGKIRAFYPNPSAKCTIKGETVKIIDAEVINKVNKFNDIGITLDNQLLVSCKVGTIRLTKIQRQGKKAMDAKVALNGWKIKEGTIISGK